MTAIGGVANSGDRLHHRHGRLRLHHRGDQPRIDSPLTTGSITVTPRAATKLVVQTQPPASVAAGSTFGFVVAAEDQFDNIDTNFAGQVSVALPAGSQGTLGGSHHGHGQRGAGVVHGADSERAASRRVARGHERRTDRHHDKPREPTVPRSEQPRSRSPPGA